MIRLTVCRRLYWEELRGRYGPTPKFLTARPIRDIYGIVETPNTLTDPFSRKSEAILLYRNTWRLRPWIAKRKDAPPKVHHWQAAAERALESARSLSPL